MSRAQSRVRPTREETRERLFHAAAEVFEARGIAAASIEDIVAAAGFTRGAFYSNFSSKDDLVLAMLDDHLARARREVEQMATEFPDPWDLIADFDRPDRRADWPLGRSFLLHTEFVLWALRDPTNRPHLADELRSMRRAVGQLITTTTERLGLPAPMPIELAAEIIMALDDGIAVHRLIDPEGCAQDTFSRAVTALQELFVRAAPPAPSDVTNGRGERPRRRGGGRVS